MEKVKIAVAGLGFIGRLHLDNITKTDNVELAAVYDVNPEVTKETAAKYKCRAFGNYAGMLTERVCDAILIAAPHYQHTSLGIEALKAGYHVLVEKPISVHKADCERLIAAHTDTKQVFAAMFNQRTDQCYRKIKKIIDDGQLGEIFRINWIITDWFRTDCYYARGSWRATWQGEGGGVLLNQCPHQLDMLQWLCGMPKSVRAFCSLGKRHDIEVEDDVTAYLEYQNGATGVFIASTGEAPGTNRLEIAGDLGKIVVENNKIVFTRNETSAMEYKKTASEPMGKPDVWNIDVPLEDIPWGVQHRLILENFADAVLTGAELLCPAAEGIHSVELANAMLYSSLEDCTVKLPLDSNAYEAKLQQLIKNSGSD